MSIYFFSEKKVNNEHEISALAGVKCLVLPKKISKSIQKKIKKSLRKQDINNISIRYSEILSKIVSSNEFYEEYDHFQCLVQSKVASIFHIRNVLLRLAFSKYMNKKIKNLTVDDRFVKKIVNYFLDYYNFWNIAYGYVEAHYQLVSKENTVDERFLTTDKIKSSLDELITVYNLKEENHQLIANIIDKKYFLFVNSKNSEFIRKMTENLFFRNLFLFFMLLYEQIFEYYVIERVFYVFYKNKKVIFPYLLSRFIPANSKNNKLNIKRGFTGNLPAIMSDGIIIDPVAFLVRQQSLKGQESQYNSEIDARKTLLLWHITSRTTAYYSLFKNGMSKTEISKYFNMLYDFNGKWSPNSKQGLDKLKQIDDKILRICFVFVHNSKSSECFSIQEIIFKVYKDWIDTDDDFNCELKVSDSSLLHAIGCTYMHI